MDIFSDKLDVCVCVRSGGGETISVAHPAAH